MTKTNYRYELAEHGGKQVFKGTHSIRDIMDVVEEIETIRNTQYSNEEVQNAVAFLLSCKDIFEPGTFNARFLLSTLAIERAALTRGSQHLPNL